MKLIALSLVACTAFALLPLNSQADLIGATYVHPVVAFDGAGNLMYDAAQDVLSIDASLLYILKDTGVMPFAQPSTLLINIMVDSSGSFVSGAAGDDLLAQGTLDLDGDGSAEYSGTLLTAEAREFGFLDIGPTDRFDFIFRVTGGAMAELFGPWIAVDLLSAEQSTFEGSFDTDFTSVAKGNIGKIVEERTIVKSGGKLGGNTRTIGFWKNNIRKHIEGKKSGFQVTKADLLTWLDDVEAFHLPQPFSFGIGSDSERLQAALDVLDYSGSDIVRKTLRQLLACELNMVSGTFAMTDASAHTGVCAAAEDAILAGGPDLEGMHNLLDYINNLHGKDSSANVVTGDQLIFTITVNATLPAEDSVVLNDCLDSSLEVVWAGNGGVYSASDHRVSWILTLPAGISETTLVLWVKLTAPPANDNSVCCGDGAMLSNEFELLVNQQFLSPESIAPMAMPLGDILRNQVCMTPISEPPVVPCGPCEGKVTQLTLLYTGIDSATVKVVQKKDGSVVFDEYVAPSQQFSFIGADRKGTLGTDIRIYVNGTLHTTIHTSCSQPIGPGLVRGLFTVVAGESKDGGPLCPLP